MSRDIFSTAACASVVSEYRSSQELHRTAMPTPLRAREIRTRNQPNATTDVVMGGDNCNVPDGRNEAHSVQREHCAKYLPVNPDHAVALRLLRSVPPPLSVKRIARALEWPEHRAAKWLRVFSAKGVLVATGKGHAWAR